LLRKKAEGVKKKGNGVVVPGERALKRGILLMKGRTNNKAPKRWSIFCGKLSVKEEY